MNARSLIVAGVAGLGVLLLAGAASAKDSFDPSVGHDEPGDPFEPGGTDPTTGKTKKQSEQPASSRVPAKTQNEAGWNVQLLPNPETVKAALAGLAPKYVIVNSLSSNARKFQEDWNALSAAGKMPANLVGTQLKVDGVVGIQTLRAIEWAMGFKATIGIGWSGLLLGAGRA